MRLDKNPPTPFLIAFAGIALGVALAKYIHLPEGNGILVFSVLALASSISAIILTSLKTTNTRFFGFVLFAIALISFGGYRFVDFSKIDADDVSHLTGEEARLYGRISGEIEFTEDRQRFEIEVDSADVRDTTVSLSGKARIYLYQASPLSYGNYIAIDADLQEPRSASNPYAYDFKKSLESSGIRAIAFVYRDTNVRVLKKSGGSFFLSKIVNPLRNHIEATIDANLHGDSSALLKGLMLGLGRKLPKDVRDAFADSGTVHILAVSGLHVGIIAGMAWLLFASIIRLPRSLSAVLTISLLVIFAGLVGGRPSVLRAGFMFSIIIIGASLNRPANLLNSIGAAGAILLAVKPVWLYDIGFQLSFGATLGIGYLLPKFQNWLPERLSKQDFVGKWVVSPFLVSLAATLGTAPLVAWHFHRFQLIGPIANLVVLPPLGMIIGYGLLAAIFQSIVPQISSLFLAADWVLLRVYLLNVVKFFADLPFAYLAFPHPALSWIFGYYTVMVSAPFLLQRLKIKFLGPITYLVVMGLTLVIGHITSVEQIREDVRITFFDVGQGDCILVEFADGREMLIDGGPPGGTHFSVTPYLQARGLEKIDAIVVSHTDADHIGGLRDLQPDFEFGVIYMPYLTFTSNLNRRFIEHADSVGTPVELLSFGDTIPGFPEFAVLWPDTNSVSSAGSLLIGPNEGSIVLMLNYGESQAFFPGDIGIPTENKIAEIADIECDIVKVPHHGSKYSTGSALLEETTPLLSVICVGAKNRFGHPADRVLDDYEQTGSTILRTDRDGAVFITLGQDKFTYISHSGDTGHFSSTAQPIPKLID